MVRRQSFLVSDKPSSYSIWHNTKSLPSNLHRRNSLRSWGQSNEGCLQQWAIDQSSQSGPIHPAARLVPAHHDPTSSLRGGSRIRGGGQPGAGETNTAQWITRGMLEQSDIHPEGGELWHEYLSLHATRSRNNF